MHVGIAADHAGFSLKKLLAKGLRELGYEVVDFGPIRLIPKDDYPDYLVPMSRAVARGEVDKAGDVTRLTTRSCTKVRHSKNSARVNDR